jgi:hypothetical protein
MSVVVSVAQERPRPSQRAARRQEMDG